MLISVVIPTYKRAALLQKCIEALLLQRFDKTLYEVIVVTDGPDPETQKVLQQFTAYEFPAIKLMALPNKCGPAATRNLGWQNSKGSIIAFTDDDCLPDCYWLAEIAKNCQPDTACAITGKVKVPISDKPTDYELNTSNLENAEFVTANCACSKLALQIVGGFDELFSMAWREDSDLHFKLLCSKIPVKKVNSAIVQHPVRQSKWGVSIAEQKKNMFDALLYKKYPALYREKIRQGPPLLYYAIIIFFFLALAGVLLHQINFVKTGIITWGALTLYFAFKRLRYTRHTLSHIAEMMITSMIIPFLSVYWHWYGSFKYKVLYL